MDSLILIAIGVVIVSYVLKTTLFSSVSTMDIEKEIDPSKSAKKEATGDEPTVIQNFTPRTLYKYNGFDLEQIYIAVLGNVYDVSSGRQFYGPSGPYSNFAGKDATRGLAMNSFEPDMFKDYGEPIDTLEDLTELDFKSLAAWEETFVRKYPKVGVLVNETDVTKKD